MSSSSDMGLGSTSDAASNPATESPLPTNWREALMALIASRVALIQLESKDATRAGAKKAGMLLAVIGCVCFAWLLLLAGGVSLIATILHWPWSWVAIGLAMLHLVIAVILAKLATTPGSSSFPVTRAEFQKDREWIENFQKAKK